MSSPPRLAYAALVAVCVIWGTTYLGIRVTLETMPPAPMAALRWLIAAAILILFLRARGEPLPPRARCGGIALMGLLLLFLGNGGVVMRSSGCRAVWPRYWWERHHSGWPAS